MHQCCVFGCRNEGNHSFPKDKNILKLWEAATGCKDFRAKKHSKMCSAHFKSEDFIKIGKFSGLTNTRRILKKGIVPSIFPSTKTVNINPKQRRALAEARDTKRQLSFSYIEKCDELDPIPNITTPTCNTSPFETPEIVIQANSNCNQQLVQSDIVTVCECAIQKYYQYYTINCFIVLEPVNPRPQYFLKAYHLSAHTPKTYKNDRRL